MRRKSVGGGSCTIARALDVIGDWWSLLIIRDAFAGRRRFGEFHRSLGVPKNILSARLKALAARGVIESVPASAGGSRREYVLTEKGKGLLPVLVALAQWGEEHLFDPGESCNVPRDAEKRRPLVALEVRSEDGRRLRPEDVVVGGAGG